MYLIVSSDWTRSPGYMTPTQRIEWWIGKLRGEKLYFEHIIADYGLPRRILLVKEGIQKQDNEGQTKSRSKWAVVYQFS